MIVSAFKQVFSQVRYIILASLIAFVVFVLSVWLQNLKLILIIITSSTATLLDKFSLLFSLLGSIQTNFTFFSAFYIIVIALLFGLNIAMITYYIQQQKSFLRQSGITVSFGGLISGLFGIGCVACGSVLISLIGAGTLIAFLPFGGQEFGILGLGLISLSIFLIAKKIQDPLNCKVNKVK